MGENKDTTYQVEVTCPHCGYVSAINFTETLRIPIPLVKNDDKWYGTVIDNDSCPICKKSFTVKATLIIESERPLTSVNPSLENYGTEHGTRTG